MQVLEARGAMRVPVHSWASDATEETLEQLERLAARPYVVGFVAAMADAHVSSGIAVGSVFATERDIVPGALGGDLGCGMTAIRLCARSGEAPASFDRRALERVVDALGAAIPAGDRTHAAGAGALPDALLSSSLSTGALEHARERLGPRHLGTLGGGNHFVELDRDAEGDVWLLVHSGSRGLGAAVAAHHLRAASGGSTVDPLAALSLDEAGGQAYLRDLTWALAFARENRRRLAERAAEIVADQLDLAPSPDTPDTPIDVPHNFVARERWLGRDLWVHRKGAIAARDGELALVPGSMGTASYVVRGCGCSASFGSSSHGAGRIMSRTEARARITRARFLDSMRRVVMPRRSHALVDEAPAAYRDIGAVLDAQRDLVRRVVRLEPLAVLKG